MTLVFKPFDVVNVIDKAGVEWISRGVEGDEKTDEFLNGAFQVVQTVGGLVWLCNDGALIRAAPECLSLIFREDLDALLNAVAAGATNASETPL